MPVRGLFPSDKRITILELVTENYLRECVLSPFAFFFVHGFHGEHGKEPIKKDFFRETQ